MMFDLYMDMYLFFVFYVDPFHSCVKGSNNVSLIAIEVTYDAKSPKFGASTREMVSGLWIDWALEETGFCKDDR